MKKLVTKFMKLEWYYQLFIALISFALLALLLKFLLWIAPFILGSLLLIWLVTDGEIFSLAWHQYKQTSQTAVNPLFDNFYHWLTESGVTELPISSLSYTQGVEVAGQGIYFVHINKEISDELLENFETKVRQVVKTMSNDSTDCVVSRYKREPFLAIKVRLVSTPDMMLMTPLKEKRTSSMIKNIFEVNSRGQPTSASVDINRFFAWIIAGPSGSGKSTFLRRLLGLISFYDTDAEAYFLDFKADEEMFPMIGDHVARGFYCLELFETVCQRFEARLSKQEENSHNLYLIFDEWQAFLAYLEQTDKKKHKDVLSKMLMMNSLGRSLGLRIILSSQRFLMSDLPGRYNFNCIISLSTSFLMSTNNRQLLFPDMEKDEVVIKPRGYGYFQLEGESVKMFRTIQVKDEERLNQRMQELFSRYS